MTADNRAIANDVPQSRPTTNSRIHRPRPSVAAILSLVVCGLGQTYAGQLKRGLLFGVGYRLASTSFTGLMLLGSPAIALLASVLFDIAFRVGFAIDASRVARQGVVEPRSPRRMVVICSFTVLMLGATALGVGAARDHWLGTPWQESSGGMWPTLLIGDQFMSDSLSLDTEELTRGDIIVFRVARDGADVFAVDRRPDLPTEVFVKRIVGTQGDTVRIKGGVVDINGETMTGSQPESKFDTRDGELKTMRAEHLGDSPYHILDGNNPADRHTTYFVEPGRYFVLGDNRSNSLDSRHFGSIHGDAISGRVERIHWSSVRGSPMRSIMFPWRWGDFWDGTIRWDRIGARL